MPVQVRFRQYVYAQPIATVVLGGVTVAALVAFVLLGNLAREWPWLVLTLVLTDVWLLIPLTFTVEPARIRVSLAGVMRTDIPVERIAAVELRRYRPLAQFAGWGWRSGRDGARQFAQTGSEAVVLTMIDGTEIYLGTRDLDGLRHAIELARSGGLG